MNNYPIGVFDSGVGGLSVVKELMKSLPNEEILYFGDNKNSPYGTKTVEEITVLSRNIVDFLIKNNAKLLVVACNTICVSCIDILQKEIDIPIFGVVKVGAIEGAELTKKKLGLLATPVTVRSKVHEEIVKKENPHIKFYAKACPLFVSVVEEGFANHKISYLLAKEYLKEFKQEKIDTVLLGCTHFPLMKKNIHRALGKKVRIVDPSLGTALEVKKYLAKNDMFREEDKKPKHTFYISGEADKFTVISKQLLGKAYKVETV